MFFLAPDPLVRDLSELKASVLTQEAIRKLRRQAELVAPIGGFATEFQTILGAAPNDVSWRVLDHCATITRLYALFERFTYRDLLDPWLEFLVQHTPTYADLPAPIQSTHRLGVSRLITRAGSSRYRQLTEQKVVEGYFAGITGQGPYQLLPQAFVLSEQNLKPNILSEHLNRIGATGAWPWICESARMGAYVTEELGGGDNAVSMLEKLVDYRNDAAHGDVADVLGAQELETYIGFVEVLCRAMAECLSQLAVEKLLAAGAASILGVVTEEFQGGAVVAQMSPCAVSVGERLAVVRDRECQTAVVQSIQVQGDDRSQVTCTNGDELGLKFDVRVRRNSRLVRIPHS